MASLALIASLVVLATIFIGPLAYICSRSGLPSAIVYTLSILAIANGIWFIFIGLPIWYMGLVPIYFGYISIDRENKKKLKLDNAEGR